MTQNVNPDTYCRGEESQQDSEGEYCANLLKYGRSKRIIRLLLGSRWARIKVASRPTIRYDLDQAISKISGALSPAGKTASWLFTHCACGLALASACNLIESNTDLSLMRSLNCLIASKRSASPPASSVAAMIALMSFGKHLPWKPSFSTMVLCDRPIRESATQISRICVKSAPK
jgi:hypothetical protein